MRQLKVERYGDQIFNHSTVTEDERLLALAAELDPGTFRRIEALPVRPDWRCLELGAGTGTVARMLAELCPEGSVIATDLDLELVRARREAQPNLTWLHHDVTRDDFPVGTFDFIHARYLFCHLRSRDVDLSRVVNWLAPGGWLLLEEPASFPIESSPHRAYRATGMGVFTVLADRIGTDCRWTRGLYDHLAGTRLRDVGLQIDHSLVGGTHPMGRFWELTVEQLAPALAALDGITEEMIEETLARLRDPDFRELGMATVAAWGRRP
ncbi:class I SAM-dependent methyltransferase [Sphaerisporangium fuscum]|uniref:class I SAM-dependent methyltransferase n=1 Tax=Sphaerisporangium fuscum TaxID=2835868 RepID=UPI001BDDBDEE|nr:class I SAM-dependent methyltransferase [Sphaerisporangium fuscum]